ncbi:unnamed protein product [Pelagomonas calceolata]|uniref:AP2/ERF domain-containing protein n=1 Tax=Pelagomonas calceolata TaxID=35677 RepID=A0A8J2SIG2_9STRA|nr:unnamed protein product [Pelagomonas calceolata]
MRMATNKSGYTGVSWASRDQVWIAQLVVNKKRVLNETFHDKEAAARAVDDARVRHGKSRVNFPEEARNDGIEGEDEAAAAAFAARRPFEKHWDRLSPAEQRACIRMLEVPEFGRLVLRFTGCACEQGWWGQFIIPLKKYWKAKLEGRVADAAAAEEVLRDRAALQLVAYSRDKAVLVVPSSGLVAARRRMDATSRKVTTNKVAAVRVRAFAEAQESFGPLRARANVKLNVFDDDHRAFEKALYGAEAAAGPQEHVVLYNTENGQVCITGCLLDAALDVDVMAAGGDSLVAVNARVLAIGECVARLQDEALLREDVDATYTRAAEFWETAELRHALARDWYDAFGGGGHVEFTSSVRRLSIVDDKGRWRSWKTLVRKDCLAIDPTSPDCMRQITDLVVRQALRPYQLNVEGQMENVAFGVCEGAPALHRPSGRQCDVISMPVYRSSFVNVRFEGDVTETSIRRSTLEANQPIVNLRFFDAASKATFNNGCYAEVVCSQFELPPAERHVLFANWTRHQFKCDINTAFNQYVTQRLLDLTAERALAGGIEGLDLDAEHETDESPPRRVTLEASIRGWLEVGMHDRKTHKSYYELGVNEGTALRAATSMSRDHALELSTDGFRKVLAEWRGTVAEGVAELVDANLTIEMNEAVLSLLDLYERGELPALDPPGGELEDNPYTTKN